MDRQAKSLKLVGFSREERRVKRKEMKEYILCRWKNKKKKRRGKEKKGRKTYMAILGGKFTTIFKMDLQAGRITLF